ncbi:MAG: SdrD B-like domain-containing protein [Saprospiraceae bacterium]
MSLLSLSSFAPVQDSFFKETIKDFHKVVFHKALKTLNTSTTETTLGQEAFMAPCPGGSGVDSRVIGDYNYNGLNDQIGGVRNVQVFLSVCNPDGTTTLVANTNSDWDGNFFFSGLSDGTKYRVDFVAPNGMYPGFGGKDFPEPMYSSLLLLFVTWLRLLPILKIIAMMIQP